METVVIKNMVCQRCIEAVSEEFRTLGIETERVELGKVMLGAPLSVKQRMDLGKRLEARGFELLTDRNAQIVEALRSEIILLVHHGDVYPPVNLSTYLSKKIGKDYSMLSSLFSAVEGITIERFYILQKIERIKELLIYDELTVGQIASRMGYSSLQHLSNQFKKTVGLTPSEFRKLRHPFRRPIDKLGK